MIPHGSIESFFHTLSQVAPITHCPDCGSVIEPIEVTLSCAETDRTRLLTLPFCPTCDLQRPVSMIKKPESAIAIAVTRHRINALVRRIRTLLGNFRRIAA
jgi:hypothetical protein